MRKEDSPHDAPEHVAVNPDNIEKELLGLKERYSRLESQFSLAVEKAELAYSSQAYFAEELSDEINAAVSAILGMVELLLESPSDQEMRDSLAVIKTSASRMRSAVADTLALSRPNTADTPLSLANFSLSDVIEQVSSQAALRIARRNLELVIKIEQDVPDLLLGDAARLRQILSAVVSNAVLSTPAGGGILLLVRAQRITLDGIMLFFAVADSGIGMTQQRIDELLSGSEQNDSSASSSSSYSALRSADSLIRKMGGRLSIRSLPGIGSRCSFCAQFDFAEEAQQVPSPTRDFEPGPQRLLLVGAHFESEPSLGAHAEHLGYKVLSLANAGEALQVIGKLSSIAAVMLDTSVKILDGCEVVRLLRAQEKATKKHVPVLALRDSDISTERLSCLQAGMDDCIKMPDTNIAFAVILDTYVSQG